MNRWIVTFLAVVAALLVLAVIGYSCGRWEEAAAAPSDADTMKYELDFIELDRKAIRDAYHDHIQHLFKTWIADPSGQPGRAVTGAKAARRAYAGAMAEIEKRERESKP